MKQEYYEKYRRLGLNIAHYRKLFDFSQMEFADEIGISRTHMSRIEVAECAVSIDVVFKIADVLNIPVAKLFNFED